jgi:hypothetical protein
MTDPASEPLPATGNDAWTRQFAELKSRYKHVREPILVALNILLHDPNVALDDAKAQAQIHGVRITAASVDAARRLRERMDDPQPAAAVRKPTNKPAPVSRRAGAPRSASDPEALIRGLVEKLQGQGNADAERLREAMRKAIAVLQAAMGDR